MSIGGPHEVLPPHGTDTAGALLVSAGDNPQRLRSEAAFAHHCGVAPDRRLVGADHPQTTQPRWRPHRESSALANRHGPHGSSARSPCGRWGRPAEFSASRLYRIGPSDDGPPP